MCEANFRVFRRYKLCYIVINMACFFFLGLGVCTNCKLPENFISENYLTLFPFIHLSYGFRVSIS
jgi:hypothetical protein